jgi:hypothetical protein
MTESNDILRALLANFPATELPPGEPQGLFESIKTRLTDAPDADEELKNLYKVKGFSDFATGLMWMVDRAQKNPGQVSVGPEDETLLLSSFRKAIGGVTPPAVEEAPMPEPAPPGAAGSGESDPRIFAGQVEQFAESVQSGSGGTRMLLEDLAVECASVAQQGGAADLVEFATLFEEFLKFISEGELFDDVRVINILSNISSTVSSWANTPADSRSGLLEEALNILRESKSHFE